MAKNKHLLHSLHHLLVGVALCLKGAAKVSHHAFMGGLILLFGVTIISYFFYLQITKHATRKLTDLVHWFEAFASLFAAYIYFEEGATYLPYIFVLASIGFFIAIFVSYKKNRRVATV